MRKFSILLLCAVMALSISCQKEAEPAAPEQQAAVAKASGKCDASCTQCQHKDGKCTCLFCNCTRYCKTCGNEIYPLNHCVCGSSGGGTTGGNTDNHEPCRVCNSYYCICNTNPKYPIEYMDQNRFSTQGGAGSLQAAYQVVANYMLSSNKWPGHDPKGSYVIYDGDRFDRSASNLGRLHMDEQLKKFKRPVIAKIRCMPEDDMNMYYGLEYYVAITGTGGPETYYTYMDLKIENSSFLDLACDTQNNRFLFEGSDKPLRDPMGTYAGCPYIVIEIY